MFLPFGLPRILRRYPEASLWLAQKASIFGFLVILSGSTYASLTLANSKLFGLKAFNMGLARKQLLKLQGLQLKLNIILESIPQLLLQLTVLWFEDFTPDIVILMSLVSSGLSIMIGIIATCIVRSQKLNDMELILQITSDNDDTRKKLGKRTGFRSKLGQKLEKVYGVEQNVIEVPTISKYNQGCMAVIVITRTPQLDTVQQFLEQKNGVMRAVKKAFNLKDKEIIKIDIKQRLSDQIHLHTLTNVGDNNSVHSNSSAVPLMNNDDQSNDDVKTVDDFIK